VGYSSYAVWERPAGIAGHLGKTLRAVQVNKGSGQSCVRGKRGSSLWGGARGPGGKGIISLISHPVSEETDAASVAFCLDPVWLEKAQVLCGWGNEGILDMRGLGTGPIYHPCWVSKSVTPHLEPDQTFPGHGEIGQAGCA
jgi:hypothetical protein